MKNNKSMPKFKKGGFVPQQMEYKDQKDFLESGYFRGEILVNKVESELEEKVWYGLKRKGFFFQSKDDFYDFVKSRCRVFDQVSVKIKTFMVDEIPFLVYNYGFKVEQKTDGNTMIFFAEQTYRFV